MSTIHQCYTCKKDIEEGLEGLYVEATGYFYCSECSQRTKEMVEKLMAEEHEKRVREEEERWSTCPKCRGSGMGTATADGFVCHECYGKGVVPHEPKTFKYNWFLCVVLVLVSAILFLRGLDIDGPDKNEVIMILGIILFIFSFIIPWVILKYQKWGYDYQRMWNRPNFRKEE